MLLDEESLKVELEPLVVLVMELLMGSVVLKQLYRPSTTMEKTMYSNCSS